MGKKKRKQQKPAPEGQKLAGLAALARTQKRHTPREFLYVEDPCWTPTVLDATLRRHLRSMAGRSPRQVDLDRQVSLLLKGEIFTKFAVRHGYISDVVQVALDGDDLAEAAEDQGIQLRTAEDWVQEFFKFASDYIALADSCEYCSLVRCSPHPVRLCAMHEARAAARAGTGTEELRRSLDRPAGSDPPKDWWDGEPYEEPRPLDYKKRFPDS